MWKSDILEFFEAFNLVIEKEYGFAESNQFIEHDGMVAEGENADDAASTTKEKKSKKKKSQGTQANNSIKFGDVLNPRFGKNGEFIGFQVRSELVRSVYVDSEFDLSHLRRIINLCIFFNKMIRDGKTDDFAIKQFRDGKVIQSDSEKKQISVAV